MPPKKEEKSEDEGDLKGLDLLIYTLYSEAFAFRTLKQMKIWDWRLTYMSRSFSLGVLIYVLFIVVLDHGYLEKEEPLAGIHLTAPLNVTWQRTKLNSPTNETYFDLSAPGSNGTSVLDDSRFSKYCRTGTTDYVGNVNGTRTYVNNTCVPYYLDGELIEMGFQSVWLYTYFQQESFRRTCVDATVVPKYYLTDPPGFPYTPNEFKFADFSDPGFVPNCQAPTSLSNLSVLTMEPERAMLTMVATYSTSWGRTRSSFATTIKPMPGVAVSLPGTLPLTFSADEQIQVSFQELLAIAGIDLDAHNVLVDGGLGPPWPTYRLSGVRIAAELRFGNFIDFPNVTRLDPFNFNDYLIMRLYPTSVGTFAGPGDKVYYTGHLFDLNKIRQLWPTPTAGPLPRDIYPWPESLFTVRSPQGVQIQFNGAGEVGRFNILVVISALVGAIIMTNVAEKMTDMSAAFFINGFRAQKFMEDMEFRIRMMLRAQLLDSPNPEQVSMFEAEIVELYGNRMYKALLKRKREAEQKKKELLQGMVEGGADLDEENAKASAKAAAEAEKAKEGAADDPFDHEAFVSTGGQPRSAPGGSRPSRRAGGAAATTPHVTQLVISGDAYVSTEFRAQGYLENCRCVRFQWYRSIGGSSYEPIPFAMMPTFYACADDDGCLLAVDAVPVTDDGFEGVPRRAKLRQPLRIHSSMLSRVHTLVDEAHAGGCTIAQGQHCKGTMTTVDDVSGQTFAALLQLATGSVSMSYADSESPESDDEDAWREGGTLALRGLVCNLDRQDVRMMNVVAPFGGSSGPRLELFFERPTDRDLVALVLRELAKEPPPPGSLLVPKEEALPPTDDEAE